MRKGDSFQLVLNPIANPPTPAEFSVSQKSTPKTVEMCGCLDNAARGKLSEGIVRAQLWGALHSNHQEMHLQWRGFFDITIVYNLGRDGGVKIPAKTLYGIDKYFAGYNCSHPEGRLMQTG